MEKEYRSLKPYVFKYKRQLVISTISGVLYNTLIVSGPIFLGKLIDVASSDNSYILLKTAFFYLGFTAFFQFSRYIKRWFIRDHFNRVSMDLREDIAESVLSENQTESELENPADLMSRTVSDVKVISTTLEKTINEGFDTWLLMISYFVTLCFINLKVTLLSSIMIPISLFIAEKMRDPLYNCSLNSRKAASKANGSLKMYLDGVFLLKLFGREDSQIKKTSEMFEAQSDFAIKEMLLKHTLLPIYSLIAGLGIIIALILLSKEVSNNNITIGTFNSYIIMFAAFSVRTKKAAAVFNRWHAGKAAWNRICEKLSDEKIKPMTDIKSVAKELVVKNLDFYYGDKKVLHNISFSAEKGEIIGVTGPVGCGKTALAKALTGLYPYDGNIFIDEVELRDFSHDMRANTISYTGHEQSLFSMSIKDNIVLNQVSFNEDAFNFALETSALINDIKLFHKGVDTVVGLLSQRPFQKYFHLFLKCRHNR